MSGNNMETRSQPRWATAAGMGAILIWSGTVALTRSVCEKLGPLPAGALVFTFAGILTVAYSLARQPRETMRVFRSLSLRNALGCGSLFLIYVVSWNLAVGWADSREQTLEVGLLNYLWPALTILFSLIFLPVRATWVLFPGIAIAVSGVFLVLTTGSAVSWNSFLSHLGANPRAYGAGLLTGITWALYSVLARKWATAAGGMVSLFLLASGLALGVAAVLLPGNPPLNRAGVVEAGMLGLMSAASYALWEYAMRRGNMVRVVVASYFTPVLSILFSCAYLAVVPDSRVWIGSAVIAAGSLLCWMAVREAPVVKPSSD